MANVNLTICSPRLSAGLDPNEPLLLASPKPDNLPPHHVLLKVDRFGFSANNITYQALGEEPHFRYFEFHYPPTTKDVSPKTYGLVPVWGFATVIASSHPRISVGERVFGYLAPTRYLLLPISPSDVNKFSFYVPRPHLPPDRRPYNQFTRCASDPLYNADPEMEDLTVLYRPLFWTSFWCEDWLFSTSTYRGASRFLISSASAKTAFTLAYLIRKRAVKSGMTHIRVAGLTSKKNAAFTRGLGLYDEVLTYDELESAQSLRAVAGDKCIYVDVAGNTELNARVCAYFAPSHALVGGILLGMASADPRAGVSEHSSWKENTSLAAPRDVSATHTFTPADMESFFMVEWLAVRRRQLPVEEIGRMQLAAWTELMRDGRAWARLEHVYGGENVRRVFQKVVAGGMGPEQGYIWSMWDRQEDIPIAKL